MIVCVGGGGGANVYTGSYKGSFSVNFPFAAKGVWISDGICSISLARGESQTFDIIGNPNSYSLSSDGKTLSVSLYRNEAGWYIAIG